MATKLEIFESFVYSAGQIVLGLLLHPYRTMQLIVKGKVFTPFVFFPLLMVALLFLGSKLDFLMSFYSSNIIFSILVKTVLIFLILWQMILAYLLIRFSRVLYK